MSFFIRPTLLLLACPLLLAGDIAGREADALVSMNEGAKARREVAVTEWRDAKFGLFIHWGLYSIPGGVWKGQGKPGRHGENNSHAYAEHIQMRRRIPNAEYGQLAKQFNPVRFDARQWVRLAKEAGMRHIVITAKHQDGFAMYGSKASDFNIVDATPFKRDPMKELAAAAREAGIGFGFYYSQARDHHHPLANWNQYGNTWDFPKRSRADFITYLDEKAKPQIRELLTGYGDLKVMWFDVPYQIPVEQCREILDMVRTHQPGAVVNSRLGGEGWDYRTLGDNQITDKPLDEPWEACMTMNHSWGYHQLDHDWKSSETLIRHLVDIVSKGGHLLLNIGPKGDGTIPEPSVTRLKKMGVWLRRNGEAIYGTQTVPVSAPAWGRLTSKGNKLYAHVFEWPKDGRLHLPDTGKHYNKAHLLADPSRAALRVSGDADTRTIQLALECPDPICTVIVVEP